MSGFYGADTDQLRNHSELLRDRARAISELRDRLQPQVLDESIWEGPDAESFRATWSGATAPLFDEVTGQITAHSTELERHAEEQDTASAAGDAGSGDGDDGGSWWDRFTDGVADFWSGVGVYNDLQGLFSKGKKIWDLARIVRESTRFLNRAEDVFQLAGGFWSYGRQITENIRSGGKELSSLAGSLLGKLGVPTGFLNKNFFGWVDNVSGWAGKAAPFLADLAPQIGRRLPLLDVGFGGWQLYEGIRDGDTFSAVTGGASMLGGGLMLAGGALSATGVGAVIGGPLALTGAIISGGAALADVGRKVYENWDSISETAANARDAVSDFVGDRVSDLQEGASNLWDGVSNAFSW